MDTHPIRIRSLLAPLVIGMLALFGICIILALAFFPQQDAEPLPTRTLTPFQYAFLATETMIPTPATETPEGSSVSTLESADPAAGSTPFSLSTEQSGTSSNRVDTTATPGTPDPLLDPGEPIAVGIYDESDSGFTYNGDWFNQENTDAYMESVLVSDIVGNSMAFRFIGTQLWLGYLGSENSGEITINIDGVETAIDQQLTDLWISDLLESGTHDVIIRHTSGGPVNLDYIEIVE
jgi:hypothetical protein